TPPPADIVVRTTMFRDWGVDVGRGLAGLILNSLFYNVTRFAAPVLGFLLAWAWIGFDPALAWPALTGGLVAVGIAVVLALSMRSSAAAGAAGRLAGRLLRRFRPAGPGPEEMEGRLSEFYSNVSDRLRWTWPAAGLSMVGLLLVEATILVVSLRFVGVSPALAAAVLIAASLLALYPLTALPFFGLGVLDASVIAFIAHRGAAEASELVAGLIVWRVSVQLVPMALGAVALGWWRRRRRERVRDIESGAGRAAADG
ncbi:MAG TPA: lysylphosphatidylglycerol synthase domain-containing protein, partial [Acidimicrobiales bacterium]